MQEWLGHSTIAMTMRYAHLASGGGKEMISALDAPRRVPEVQRRGSDAAVNAAALNG